MTQETVAPATPEERCLSMTRALRDWDPDAEVQLDSQSGRLSIMTTLPTERVVSVLHAIGEAVEPESSDAEPREACCGCGCKHDD